MSELSTDRDSGQQLVAAARTRDGWVDRFATEWRKDRRLTARRFVELYPESAADRHLLALLAFEEFRLRSEAGEAPNSLAFLGDFTECRDDLEPLLAVYRFIGGASGLSAALLSSQAQDEASLSDAPTFEGGGPLEAPGEWPEPGQTLGGFKLVEMLGRGAYARVYLAEEAAIGSRRVVVKASLGGGNEAHTLGKLVHPNIVPIYSVQTEPEFGLTLICMPFLGRATLHDVLDALYHGGRARPTRGRDFLDALAAKTGQRPAGGEVAPQIAGASYVEAVVHVGAQLADALAYTNEKSILHRDLKPSNVLIDASGKPMLLDFNLSYDVERRTRRVGGTLGYAAPEILSALIRKWGDEVPADTRSDLYSLGVILYELLGGQLPYDKPPAAEAADGNPVEGWLSEQQRRPRPLVRHNPHVWPELASLIERCLACDVEERPATAFEVAAALRRQLTLRSRIIRWAKGHRRTLAVVLALAFTLVAAGGYAAATRPSYAERQLAAARAAAGRGEYESVLKYLDEAEQYGLDREELFPLRGEAHYRLAQRAFDKHDFAAARDHCSKAIDSRLTTWQVHLLRARARFRLDELDPALDDITAALDRRVLPELVSARGDCMCGKYKWESAVLAYRKALERGFSTAGLLNNMAYALINSSDREASLEYLDRAITADRRLVDAYYQRASVTAALAVDGKRDVPLQAIRDIETAIQLRPNNYQIHLKAALIYFWDEKAGGGSDREKAIESVLTALRLGLDPVELPRQGDLAELTEVVRRSPKYAEALAEGSRVERADSPGLVDSLDGLSLDEPDKLADLREAPSP
ncbi:MAG TPA: protein kinase [Pirellulales bacterium]|nr:protein kinase [Pirellulales bacterium]